MNIITRDNGICEAITAKEPMIVKRFFRTILRLNEIE